MRALYALSLCTLLALPASATAPPEIWFVPATWSIKPEGGLSYAEHDFPALLAPNASWQNALSHITVLYLPGNVAWSYNDLPSLVRFLGAHHLKFGLSLGTMFGGGLCGIGIEGFSNDVDFNHEAVTIARLWKQAGGTLDYAVMDSPFYFGRYYAKDCHFDTAEIARRSGATMRRVLSYFPTAKIVDAEGPGAIADDIWLPDMQAWFQDFQLQSSYPIDSVELDLHWHDLRPGNTWQNTAARSAEYFGRVGVRVGLIVNAEGGPGVTDESWMQANRQHIDEIPAIGGIGLSYLAIDQWMGHVRNNLPESDPGAYTSLVNILYTVIHAAESPAK